MPVSIVIGGQYGSEGKGKVALETVRRDALATLAVRPGGTNSGHTGFTMDGHRHILRQLPAAAIDGKVGIIIPAGSYVDPQLLLSEIAETGIDPSSVHVDPRAHVITNEHRKWEHDSSLTETIGSTGSGTGAAVLSRLARYAPGLPNGRPAGDDEILRRFLHDTVSIMRSALDRGERIVIEGTQGFGLSPIHGDVWPKATSRDTTAAAFLSEAGLAPHDVDDIVLVIRSHPIRVAGDSGTLLDETSWAEIARLSGGPWTQGELTSVTRRTRRVGGFNAEVVRRAIAINQPHRIVLNHLDQVDYTISNTEKMTERVQLFINNVEHQINRKINEIGTGEKTSLKLNTVASHA